MRGKKESTLREPREDIREQSTAPQVEGHGEGQVEAEPGTHRNEGLAFIPFYILCFLLLSLCTLLFLFLLFFFLLLKFSLNTF